MSDGRRRNVALLGAWRWRLRLKLADQHLAAILATRLEHARPELDGGTAVVAARYLNATHPDPIILTERERHEKAPACTSRSFSR